MAAWVGVTSIDTPWRATRACIAAITAARRPYVSAGSFRGRSCTPPFAAWTPRHARGSARDKHGLERCCYDDAWSASTYVSSALQFFHKSKISHLFSVASSVPGSWARLRHAFGMQAGCLQARMRGGVLSATASPRHGSGHARCGERVPGADRVATYAPGGARVAGVGLARPPVSVVREKRGFSAAAPSLARCCCVPQLSSRSRQSAGAARAVGLVFVRLKRFSRTPPTSL